MAGIAVLVRNVAQVLRGFVDRMGIRGEVVLWAEPWPARRRNGCQDTEKGSWMDDWAVKRFAGRGQPKNVP